MPSHSKRLLFRALFLVLAWLATTSATHGQIWSRANLQDAGWSQLAASSDGSKIVAVGLFGGSVFDPFSETATGPILLSSDFGLTWTQAEVPYSCWLGVTSSTNGNTLIAVSEYDGSGTPGYLYWSTNAGTTWREIPNWTTNQFGLPGNYYYQFGALASVACSADGRIWVLGIGETGSGGITISTNGGPWTPTSFPNLTPLSIVASADASRLLVTTYNDPEWWVPIYWISTNTGGTWAQTTTPGGFTESASSADGTLSVAAIYDTNQAGGIYFSTNAWATWISSGQTGASGGWWLALASLAPGGKLLAVSASGGIYLTMGTGTAWPLVHSPGENWDSMVCSPDGLKLAGVIEPYYPQTPPTNSFGIYFWPSMPALSISPLSATNQLLLSWPISTPSLALAASDNLIGTNWTSITNLTTTTNGLLQAVAPVPTGNMFFRIRAQ